MPFTFEQEVLMGDEQAQICPKCFKRGVLKEKNGKMVYEHNLMQSDPQTSAVTFRFTYCSAESPNTEEPK